MVSYLRVASYLEKKVFESSEKMHYSKGIMDEEDEDPLIIAFVGLIPYKILKLKGFEKKWILP